MMREYISQKKIVQNISTIDELSKLTSSKKKIHIMMGQTFDNGQPVDMMNYALFIMNLSEGLQRSGNKTVCKWLIADHFMIDINQDHTVSQANKLVEKRINFLKLLNNIYGGKIGFVRSSELSQSSEYKTNLNLLLEEAFKNSRFKELVLNSIPKDRRDNPNAIRYPLEELATIQTMKTDIKIGPPYEALYDKPAREIAPLVGFKKYVAIHLPKALPMGEPEINCQVSNEIDQFGVLPYKIGSKGLYEYRIDVLADGIDKVQKLVQKTKCFHTLTNLLIATEQAKQRLNKDGLQNLLNTVTDLNFETEQVIFRERVVKKYERFIYEPLRKIN